MSAVHNSSVESTVNAAATAIVTAESRVQPTTDHKKRWKSYWSLYWCFGSHKQSKKIKHASLVPEPQIPGSTIPNTETLTHSSTILLPFIAPPSSPASFLQSDPPSATQTPGGPLARDHLSTNDYSPPGPASIFATGPYAHETQLVSPPIFSTFTTEPSTASFTPPSGSLHPTRPSSPEVPFAQLLASSLGRSRRNNGKVLLSQYDFQPYQPYQGSPISSLISPGSVVSNSGTSSPYLDKNFSLKFHIGEVPKILELENFSIRKWGNSRLGSGTLTPEVADVASQNVDTVVDHRVSFELKREDVVPIVNASESLRHGIGVCSNVGKIPCKNEDSHEEESPKKYRSISFGSIKEFNFDSTKGELSEKSEWWANEKIIGEELDSQNNWIFFPVLQSGVI